MICLLDTHTFIWAISDTDKLSKHALEMITNTDNVIFVSVVSFFQYNDEGLRLIW